MWNETFSSNRSSQTCLSTNLSEYDGPESKQVIWKSSGLILSTKIWILKIFLQKSKFSKPKNFFEKFENFPTKCLVLMAGQLFENCPLYFAKHTSWKSDFFQKSENGARFLRFFVTFLLVGLRLATLRLHLIIIFDDLDLGRFVVGMQILDTQIRKHLKSCLCGADAKSTAC